MLNADLAGMTFRTRNAGFVGALTGRTGDDATGHVPG